MSPSRLLAVASLLVATPAFAERLATLDHLPDLEGLGTPCVTVPMPPQAFTPHAGQISSILYLERCVGGCTVRGASVNDARAMTSAIPNPGTMNAFPEFANHLGETGPAADAEWNALVACVREVYSYYDVQVTDLKPSAGLSFHMNLVSGTPGLIGLPGGTLGISPFACSAQDNIISFSFADAHNASTADAYVKDLCWTATHEAGHAFSLEHAWTFADGRSACNDPMSYPTGNCEPQRYFRNEPVICGGFSPEPCVCGPTQTSHLKLTSVFGAGTPTVPAPAIEVVTLAPNAQLGAFVNASGGSKRGIAKVELFVNGHKWGEAPGAAFGQIGQPNPYTYSIKVPDDLPGGVVDIMVRAHDDIGTSTDSAVVTALKGAPCESADSCAKGQQCEAGKCFWDAPTGELGDACGYAEFCLSGLCQGTAEQQICTQPCIPGVVDSCPTNLTCVESGPGTGVCFLPPDEGGCNASGGAPWGPVAFGAAGLLLVLGRRRRNR